ncbi:MAG TPA: S46 family peptidase [Ignavibacteriaceae bacterium]|nr:S46 family peptidase [Ignavibacteriaceae bacterium]
MKNKLFRNIVLNSLFLFLFIIGCSSSIETTSDKFDPATGIKLDTVKAGKFDTGKMWTFEYPPTDYFSSEYNFKPTTDWFNHVRMAALRFATYCSASFVSEDGLVMTNNHCARESIVQVQQEGEDLNETGFFALNLEEERKVPGLFVDQLVLIKDVTGEINSADVIGLSEEERSIKVDSIINEIESRETEETGLTISITPLYNGGKYSLYGYKRFNDVRLVFSPESQLGFFGGDPDNFTYPRYNLDCSFFRVYDEDGKPLKTDNFLKWNPDGAEVGEAVFVVGNPGTTNRLQSVAQLEYYRDYQYPRVLDLLQGLIDLQMQLMEERPEEKDELEVHMLTYTNSLKAYGGILDGLRDPVLMQRKSDFENSLISKVKNKPDLNAKYGDVWDNLNDAHAKLSDITHELYLTSFNPVRTSQYFFIASDLIDLANELKLPEDQRSETYKGEELQTTIDNIYPEDFDESYNNKMLKMHIHMLNAYLGSDHHITQILTNGLPDKEALDYAINKSSITSKEKIKALVDKGADAILSSDDPFIRFVLETEENKNQMAMKSQEYNALIDNYNQKLGRALFEVYGTSIPPDATFTLRISDGVVKGFPYNGTEAPPITTFYGIYDRYFGFENKFPWSLPERWKNPPAEFNMETPFNFITTNDIIGGNSGSPVINIKGEVVGLAFDGNIQSLPGMFIFREEENRCVAVHSAGMLEAIRDMYKVTRLSDELMNGKLNEEELTESSTSK